MRFVQVRPGLKLAPELIAGLHLKGPPIQYEDSGACYSNFAVGIYADVAMRSEPILIGFVEQGTSYTDDVPFNWPGCWERRQVGGPTREELQAAAQVALDWVEERLSEGPSHD